MPTRNIVLTDQQAQFVEQMVASGRYQNASEVLREGLRLVYEREKELALRLQSYQHFPIVNTMNVAAPLTPNASVTLFSSSALPGASVVDS